MFPNSEDQQIPDWRKKMPNWMGPPPVDYNAGVQRPVPLPNVAPAGSMPSPLPPPIDAGAPETAAVPPPPVREALTGQNPGNVQVAAPQPPPVKAETPEQDRYRQMVQAGPKTSVLGTLAGLGVKAAAGWASTPGRPAHVNDQRLQDWSERSPTGGPWREGIARQGQLAGMEQAETTRQQAASKAATDAAHTQAQTEREKAEAGYYGSHARTNEQDAATRAAKERADVAKADADRLLKEKLAKQTADGNKLRITIEQAKEYDIAPTEQETQQGYVEVDRRAWGRVLGQQAKPDTTKLNEDYWINQKANSKPGSPEYIQAEGALKDFRGQSLAKRPHYPTQAEKTATSTTAVKRYVGGLEKQYAGDYKKIREHIAIDEDIDDEALRADALRFALQQERLARDPSKKRSLGDLYAPTSPPPVNVSGGGRGSPQATDPAGVRQFVR